jgi:hypothetical protein
MPIFQNAQWIVEDDGMGPVKSLPPYDIAIERVFELTERGAQKFYDWPVHMADKMWVDVGLFNEAFDRAIRHYSRVSGEPIDEEMLRASYAEAYRIAGRGR